MTKCQILKIKCLVLEHHVITLWRVKLPKKVLLRAKAAIQLNPAVDKTIRNSNSRTKVSKTKDCPRSAASRKESSKRQLKRLQSLRKDLRPFVT